MKWFKHYSDAEYSESLSKLEAKLGFEGLGRYWRFVEFLSRQFDGVDVCFAVESAKIRQLLRLRSLTDWRSFADQLTTIRGIEIEHIGTVCEIKAPILLELQGRDFKKARTERAQAAPKIKNRLDKDKDKDISTSIVVEKSTPMPNIKFDAKSVDEIFSIIPEHKKTLWTELYADEEFIIREVKKAFDYYSDNPKKKPKSTKSWLRTLSAWLERSWGYRAKSLPGNKQTQNTDLKNAHLVAWLNETEEGA